MSFEVKAETVIGRAGADVNLDDPELSRRHVALHAMAQGVVIEDLGSLNGTVVNGQRISEPTLIPGNAVIELGATRLALELSAPLAESADKTRLARDVQVTRAGVRGESPAASRQAAEDVVAPAAVERPARPPAQRRPSQRRRRTMLVAATIFSLALGGAAVAVVLATTGPSSHPLNVFGTVTVIEQVGQPGAPGSSQVEVAKVHGTWGNGAAIQHAVIGAPIPGGGVSVNGIAQLFFPKGTFTTHYIGRAILQPDGSFHLVATEHIVASSGMFAGASGTEHITGLNRIGVPTSTFHAQGEIKY
jgi:hypothetical protein